MIIMVPATLSKGVDPMGRGRQKAKQTKVARKLKYYSPETDLEALARELSGASAHDADSKSYEEDEDPYAKYIEDDEDDYEDASDYEDYPWQSK